MAKLNIIFGNSFLDIVPLCDGETCMIGRDAACEVVIDEAVVSFHHAKIESQGKGFLLVDLNSANGTFVNRKRIDAFWLNDGDTISVGNHMLVFSNPLVVDVPDKLQKSVVRTTPMDTGNLKDLLQRNKSKASIGSDTRIMGSMVLVPLSGLRRIKPLGEKPITFGKASTSDIQVRDLWIGKRAAIIEKMEDGWYFSCVGGFPRPRVNGAVVKRPVKLQQFDIINFRKTRFQVMIR